MMGARLVEDFFVLSFGNMRFLSLCSNCISDVSGVEIGRALKGNTCVETLLLRDNQLSDDTAWEIGESLRFNKTLTKLDLSKNYVQVRGGEKIAEVLLKENRTLRWLSLGDNLMSDIVVPTFRSLVKKNKKLDVLVFSGNQFRDKLQKSLQVVWDEKMKVVKEKEEVLKGDNSYKKTYEIVKMRIKEREKAGKVSPVSLKKVSQKAMRSVLVDEGFFEGGKMTNPKQAIKVADVLSPGGHKWGGGWGTALKPLKFYTEGRGTDRRIEEDEKKWRMEAEETWKRGLAKKIELEKLEEKKRRTRLTRRTFRGFNVDVNSFGKTV